MEIAFDAVLFGERGGRTTTVAVSMEGPDFNPTEKETFPGPVRDDVRGVL